MVLSLNQACYIFFLKISTLKAYFLSAVQTQIRLVSTTLLKFSAALDKDVTRGNEKVVPTPAELWCIKQANQ